MIDRYSRPEMASLWSPEARLRRWRDIELYALEAMVSLQLAPAEALAQSRERAGDFTARDVARIEEIERTTKHDVIGFLTFLEERIGPAPRGDGWPSGCPLRMCWTRRWGRRLGTGETCCWTAWSG